MLLGCWSPVFHPWLRDLGSVMHMERLTIPNHQQREDALLGLTTHKWQMDYYDLILSACNSLSCFQQCNCNTRLCVFLHTMQLVSLWAILGSEPHFVSTLCHERSVRFSADSDLLYVENNKQDVFKNMLGKERFRENYFSVSCLPIHPQLILLRLIAVSMALLSDIHYTEIAILRVLLSESHKGQQSGKENKELIKTAHIYNHFHLRTHTHIRTEIIKKVFLITLKDVICNEMLLFFFICCCVNCLL